VVVKRKLFVLCALLCSGHLLASLKSLRKSFSDGIENLEKTLLSDKQGVQKGIKNLLDLRQEARKEIRKKTFTRQQLPQLVKSRKAMLKKISQLAGIAEPKNFRAQLQLEGFARLSRADRAKMLIQKANSFLSKNVSSTSQNDLIFLFDLVERITIFKNNQKVFLLKNPVLHQQLMNLSDKLLSKMVSDDSVTTEVEQEKAELPPLPPRGHDIVQSKGISTPPPLPPRLTKQEKAELPPLPPRGHDIVQPKDIPTPPPLPPSPTKQKEVELSSSEQSNLLRDLHKGKKLEPATERKLPEKMPEERSPEQLLKAIREDRKALKPASERKLSEKPEEKLTTKQQLDLELTKRRKALKEDVIDENESDEDDWD